MDYIIGLSNSAVITLAVRVITAIITPIVSIITVVSSIKCKGGYSPFTPIPTKDVLSLEMKDNTAYYCVTIDTRGNTPGTSAVYDTVNT